MRDHEGIITCMCVHICILDRITLPGGFMPNFPWAWDGIGPW